MDKDKGFTLIEVMIVLAIIGIIIATIIPIVADDFKKDDYEIVQPVKPDKNPQLPMENDRYTHDNKY